MGQRDRDPPDRQERDPDRDSRTFPWRPTDRGDEERREGKGADQHDLVLAPVVPGDHQGYGGEERHRHERVVSAGDPKELGHGHPGNSYQGQRERDPANRDDRDREGDPRERDRDPQQGLRPSRPGRAVRWAWWPRSPRPPPRRRRTTSHAPGLGQLSRSRARLELLIERAGGRAVAALAMAP